MKNIYRVENQDIFERWIYYQIKNQSSFLLETPRSHAYKISYKNKTGFIRFKDHLEIEEEIYEDDEIVFELHYQFHAYHYAVRFFECMMQAMKEELKSSNFRILLCCTGGLTTGFFADKMNQYMKINQETYQIDASSVFEADQLYQNYDLVLIAPQLKYKIPELSKKYHPTVVQSIEPMVFARYDCEGVIHQIHKLTSGRIEI